MDVGVGHPADPNRHIEKGVSIWVEAWSNSSKYFTVSGVDILFYSSESLDAAAVLYCGWRNKNNITIQLLVCKRRRE